MTRFRPRLAWLALAAVSASAVTLSLVLTSWFHQDPCHLCVFQRFLFMVLTGLTLAAASGATHLVGRLFGGLAVLTAAGGAAVAGYQSWLQLRAPEGLGLGLCSAGDPGLIERFVDWLGTQVPSLFVATGFCEEDGVALLGLTLANWTMIAFAVCLAITVWILWRSRSHNGPI